MVSVKDFPVSCHIFQEEKWGIRLKGRGEQVGNFFDMDKGEFNKKFRFVPYK
jgi:hypothetical protein